MFVLAPVHEPRLDNLRGPVRDTPLSDEPLNEGVPNSLLAKIAIARAICGCPIERLPGFFQVPGVPRNEPIAALCGLVENSFPGSNTEMVRIAIEIPNTSGEVAHQKILRALPGAITRDSYSTVIVDKLHNVSGAYRFIAKLVRLMLEANVTFVLCWDDTHARARKIERCLEAARRSGATFHGSVRFGHYPEAHGEQFAQMCCDVLFSEWHPPVWVYGRLAYWAGGSVRRLRLYAELLRDYHVHVGQRDFTPLKTSQYLAELASAIFGEQPLDFSEALGDSVCPEANVVPLNWVRDPARCMDAGA